jgi:hypothetical protein
MQDGFRPGIVMIPGNCGRKPDRTIDEDTQRRLTLPRARTLCLLPVLR